MNQNKTNINWYPGHMAKTKRQIKEKIDEIILGKIIEISDIIFEDESLKIITKGREVIL